MLGTRLPNKITKGTHQKKCSFCNKTQCFFYKSHSVHARPKRSDRENQCFRHQRKFIPCTHVQRGARHSVHTRSYEGPIGQTLGIFSRLNFRSLIYIWSYLRPYMAIYGHRGHICAILQSRSADRNQEVSNEGAILGLRNGVLVS